MTLPEPQLHSLEAAYTVNLTPSDLIDLTVVNVALPTLQREFDATAREVQWAVTAYILALGVVMPASGWAADRFGAKRTFLFAVAAFTVASALSAVAWSLESLVAFRALQGIGGGLLVPIGMAMLFRAFPEEERGRASAIFSTPAALAPALGPLLGGVLVDELSWRWIFFVNLPIGALALTLGARVLREHIEPAAGAFDAPGFALAGAAVVALVLGLSLIPSETLSGGAVAALLIAGTLLFGVFARVELRRADPMVDLRLFRRRRRRPAAPPAHPSVPHQPRHREETPCSAGSTTSSTPPWPTTPSAPPCSPASTPSSPSCASPPGDDIGREAHDDRDQFLRIEQGNARVGFGATENTVDETHDVGPGWAIIVPAGTSHNVVNTGDSDLKLYWLYSPPEHPDGTLHRTKADADTAEGHA